TTTNEYPKPSPWGTIAGLGMTALGAMSGNPMMMGSGLKGAMGQAGMGGPQGGMFGYQPYSPTPYGGGSMWAGAPNGPYSMAPTFFARGGAVDLEDIGGSYADGGFVDTPMDFNDRFNTIGDDPRVTSRIQDGLPLQPEMSVLPPQQPPQLPPEIAGPEPEPTPA